MALHGEKEGKKVMSRLIKEGLFKDLGQASLYMLTDDDSDMKFVGFWWTSHLDQPSFKMQGYTGGGLLAVVPSGVPRSRRCTSPLSNCSDSRYHYCGFFLEKLAEHSPWLLSLHLHIPTSLTSRSFLKEGCCNAATGWTKKVAMENLTFDPTAAG